MENLRESLSDLQVTMDMAMLKKSIDDIIEKGSKQAFARAVDDFINNISMNIEDLKIIYSTEDEYRRFKNNFMLAIEEELTNLYNIKHRD